LVPELVARVPDGATALAFEPATNRGVVAGRTGRVYAVAGTTIDLAEPVLDLRDDTQDEGDGGLLGLAYSPDGDWLFVYRSTDSRDEEITAYPVTDAVPDGRRGRAIMHIDHPPSLQHHGGGFAFGPDGLLYIGTGDGGGLGDPRGNAQDLGSLLGKVLRLDPTPGDRDPYRIPAHNPFVGRPGARAEIFAYGLRNPFRLVFDDVTGELWIGDVGQSCWEELDRLEPARAAGANLGWDRREGTHRFEGRLDGGVDPVHTYSHRGGNCAVVAGFVYRGTELRGLDGTLLYTDYCRGRLLAFIDPVDDAPIVLDLGVRVERPVAIVAGPDGTPWLLSLDGEVARLVAAPPFTLEP
jgi:hypothetical protein